jgi:hypothetical protein
MQSWGRRHRIEGFQVAYFCTLLACGSLFGLFVGGYVGYVDAVTPPADSHYGLAQPATSDVQWAAMMRQYRSASQCPSESAGRSGQETPWQRLTGGATVPRGVYIIPLDTPGLRSVKKAVVTR